MVAVALLAACDHTAPFDPPGAPNPGPRGSGNPIRVTYNPGLDLRPSWLPDGSGFFYTLQRTDRDDGDRCLALMASGGGTVQEQICDRAITSDDSIATFESAAMASGGRFAYMRASTPLVPPTVAPRTLELRLGTRAAPTGAIVRSFPYTALSGRVHQGLSSLRWVGSQLVYLAEEVRYERACGGCPLDTLRIGIEVVTIDLSTTVPLIVPGTSGANSVAVAGSDTIYYVRDSNTVIERQALSSGTVTAAFDFGEPVRDVTAGGGRLAAVTGRGFLWLVQPGAGALPLTASSLVFFKRPALSPDGGRLVVEGYPFRVDTIHPPGGPILSIDTIVNPVGDLWLFDLP